MQTVKLCDHVRCTGAHGLDSGSTSSPSRIVTIAHRHHRASLPSRIVTIAHRHHRASSPSRIVTIAHRVCGRSRVMHARA
jgi:hypothetical protein